MFRDSAELNAALSVAIQTCPPENGKAAHKALLYPKPAPVGAGPRVEGGKLHFSQHLPFPKGPASAVQSVPGFSQIPHRGELAVAYAVRSP